MSDPTNTSWGGCGQCIHYKPSKAACPAFPEGIPLAIASGDLPHTRILIRQVGNLVFTPKKTPQSTN